jgi:sugar phosphate isomerase/epimerase
VQSEFIKTSLALTPAPLERVPCLYAGRLAHGLRRAADLGYDAVELHLRDPAAEDLESVRRETDRLGLAVSSFGSGQGATVDGLTLTAVDPQIRERALQRLRGHVAAAAEFGAVVVIGSMQGRLEADPRLRALQLDGACEALAQLADAADARNVRVLIEPLNRYETNFNNTAADVLALLERVQRPALGVLLDTFHMNIEETSSPDAIRRAGRHLGLVHLADSNRGAAGTGHTDFAPILAALRAIDYTGYLSAEILPMGNDEASAATSIAAMRKLIGREAP